MNKTILNIIRFVALILFQVFVVNHIRLGGYVHPYVYVIFVMLLPINIPNWQLLLSGFGIGLAVDLFCGTPGLHAGATTFMAFCRPFILDLLSGHQKYENVQSPNLNQLDGIWFVKYTSCMVLVHHLFLFVAESFSFKLFGQVLLRILISAPVSVFLIMMILYIFKSDKKRDSR